MILNSQNIAGITNHVGVGGLFHYNKYWCYIVKSEPRKVMDNSAIIIIFISAIPSIVMMLMVGVTRCITMLPATDRIVTVIVHS